MTCSMFQINCILQNSWTYLAIGVSWKMRKSLQLPVLFPAYCSVHQRCNFWLLLLLLLLLLMLLLLWVDIILKLLVNIVLPEHLCLKIHVACQLGFNRAMAHTYILCVCFFLSFWLDLARFSIVLCRFNQLL